MTTPLPPAILGTGYALPLGQRENTDPIFDWLRKHNTDPKKLFSGYDKRHYLIPGETIVGLMKTAAEMAMTAAGVVASDIDLIIGDASVSDYQTPNGISGLHHALGLDARVWPIAVTNAFSQFPAAVMMADALIRAGRAKTILIAFGDNWTQFVDYQTPQAASAGDGAAACVMGQGRSLADWTFVDQRTLADTSYYGSMYMAADQRPNASRPPQDFSHPFFHISPKGTKGFTDFGLHRSATVVNDLLTAQPGLTRAQDGTWQDVCLISHQASATLMDYWKTTLKPELVIETLQMAANLVHCSVPFNLAYAMHKRPDMTQNHLVTLTLGPDMHANATLFRRNS